MDHPGGTHPVKLQPAQDQDPAPRPAGRSGSLTVRSLRTAAEMRAGVELYRGVFALPASDPAVSPRLLVAIAQNGGLVLGALDGDEVVGFVYGFTGRSPDTGEVYHYSQLAVVAPHWQGRGVGRRLKVAQRDAALAQGLTRMRWSFDPFRGQTAHFNLDVLGAVGRWLKLDLYGEEGLPREQGLPSHRLIADWDLEASRRGEVPRSWPPPPAGLPPGRPVADGDDVWFALPSLQEGLAGSGDARSRVGEAARALAGLTERGLVAVSCQRAADGSLAYRFRDGG